MDRRKKHRPKAAAGAETAAARKSKPAKGERHIRPAVRTPDSGKVTWRPNWAGGGNPRTGPR